MFEDFSFCTECGYYDRAERKCKLFQCVRVNGCSSGIERKPRNHFEEIKAMSMEQMAEFFTPFYYKGLYHFYCPAVADVGDGECSANDGCRECFAKWLKEEINAEES